MTSLQIFSKSSRLTFAMVGLGLLGLVSLSRFGLTPDSQGFGTHRQLGLPSCMTLFVTGLPCPSCGMTTSWAYGMRGEFLMAMKANLAGLCLLFQALFSAPVLFWIAIRGTSTPRKWFSRVTISSLVVVILIALLQWALRLAGISLF